MEPKLTLYASDESLRSKIIWLFLVASIGGLIGDIVPDCAEVMSTTIGVSNSELYFVLDNLNLFLSS